MLNWEKCIMLDWSCRCSAIWISSPSPKSPTLNYFHWGLRPKLNMSKEDDTDNSHNRSNHMLPYFFDPKLSKNFQSWRWWMDKYTVESVEWSSEGRFNALNKIRHFWLIIAGCTCYSHVNSALLSVFGTACRGVNTHFVCDNVHTAFLFSEHELRLLLLLTDSWTGRLIL